MPVENKELGGFGGDAGASALRELLVYLATQNYAFVTPTPVTHDIVMQRPDTGNRTSLTAVLGWNFPFVPGTIDPIVEALLNRANAIEKGPTTSRSLIRVAKLHGELFLHSGFPTSESDAVFFGPDSYRFADLIERELTDFASNDSTLIVDIGTGSGVGAIVAARIHSAAQVIMTDINEKALRIAEINAAAAGISVSARLGSELADVASPISIALANPPYIIDPAARLYRDGGGELGGDISIRMARAAVARLAPGGRLILYTGSAIRDGEDLFRQDMLDLAHSVGATLRYREIDPDVFGEELREDAYAEVDRIAVVAAVLDMPDRSSTR